MRTKSTRGYVLKVAVASASIGCATLACESQHPVGMVAEPPKAPPAETSSASAPPQPTVTEVGTIARPPDQPVGTVAQAPDAPDAAAKTPPAPKPTAHKVGTIARPPDGFGGTRVGTTASSPDGPPPQKK